MYGTNDVNIRHDHTFFLLQEKSVKDSILNSQENDSTNNEILIQNVDSNITNITQDNIEKDDNDTPNNDFE